MPPSPSVEDVYRRMVGCGLPVPPNSANMPYDLQNDCETRDRGVDRVCGYYAKRFYPTAVGIPGVTDMYTSFDSSLMKIASYRYQWFNHTKNYELASSVFKHPDTEPTRCFAQYVQETPALNGLQYGNMADEQDHPLSKCVYTDDKIFILETSHFGTIDPDTRMSAQLYNILDSIDEVRSDGEDKKLRRPQSIVITDIPESRSRTFFRKVVGCYSLSITPQQPAYCLFTPGSEEIEERNVFYALLGTDFMKPIMRFMHDKLIERDCDGISTVEIANFWLNGQIRTDIRVTFQYRADAATLHNPSPT